MNKEQMAKYISNEISHNRGVETTTQIGGIPYRIKFLPPNKEKSCNIPSILAIPQVKNMNNQLVLESNNLESNKMTEILENGSQTGIKLAQITKDKPTPIVIPLIPSEKNAPYFQQLSKECFELPENNKNYRMDNQVVGVIEQAREIIKNECKIDLKDKIFLNGYSSSGVFAQRFALLHPELIEKACIGGASGSIPIPVKDLEYPLGIKNYKELFGKEFDYKDYAKIDFKYFVGELELQDKTKSRVDEFGNPAPVHDMSYFDRSVPKEEGKKQRDILGKDMFLRANNTVKVLNKLGYHIEHTVIPGRTHSNKNGKGVAEEGDKFVQNEYMKKEKQKEDFER